MIKSNFDIENELIDRGYQFVIGIDEVGRGPLAGPVVAAAVVSRNFQSASSADGFPISNDKNFIKKRFLKDLLQNSQFICYLYIVGKKLFDSVNTKLLKIKSQKIKLAYSNNIIYERIWLDFYYF